MNQHPRTAEAALAGVRVSFLFLSVIASAALGTACVQTNPPTDTGNPAAPSSPSPSQPTPQPTPAPSASLAYNPDLKPIFDSDCVVCHGGSRPSAGYSMVTYANVMAAVAPGNPNSPLVVWAQPGGSMYRYWTGNALQKATMVKQWVVNNNAAQSR